MLLEDFNIEFGKYNTGNYELDYKLQKDFFKLFENSSLENGDIEVHIDFERKDYSLIFTVNIMGFVSSECDRCLKGINIPIENNSQLFVKITENIQEDEENLTHLHPNESYFNIAGYLYEVINLSLPMKKTCDEIREECDPEVIAKLREIAVDKSTESENEQKPEWDKLKDIINNLKK